MKTPLKYQVTEYDCGTVSLLNVFSFLYDREDIPVELVRAIYSYTLDCPDDEGNVGAGGTSREAVNNFTNWVLQYADNKNFKIKCERLERDKVTLDKIRNCLDKNGCVFIRCWQECEHYALLTKIDKKHVYIFDPYYLDKKEYNNDKDVQMIFNKPFSYNRKVSLKRLSSETSDDFSLGKISNRECVLFNRI